MKNIALILASGTGQRCKLGFPKQFAKINDKTIIEHTIDIFEKHSQIDEIILVTSKECYSQLEKIVLSSSYKKVSRIILGGATRKDSSYNGIYAISDNEANVLIHDGVRPLVSSEIISNCIKALEDDRAVCVTFESSDTVYVVDENGYIKAIPQRKTIRRAQTPQCFKLSLIKKAHELANNDPSCSVTDDCGLIMYYNLANIRIIEGDVNNIKITYPEDIELAKKYLK